MMEIGSDAATGLALGLTGGVSKVQQASAQLANAITNGFGWGGGGSGGGSGSGFGWGGGGASGPGWMLGSHTVASLIKGLTDGLPKLKSTVAEIIKTFKQLWTAEGNKPAWASGWGGGEEGAILQQISNDNKRLQALATQRQKIANEIKAANQYASQVSSSLISSTGLSNITLPSGDTGAGYAANVLSKTLGLPAGEITQIITEYKRALQDLGTATTTPAKAESIFAGILTQIGLNATQAAAAMKAFKSALSGESSINTGQTPIVSIQQQMDAQLKQLQAFDHNIDVLRKMGLNKTLLNQIIQAGYQQGGALAQALAHGSEQQIGSLNATEEAIIKASKKIGKDGAEAMYDTGTQAAKGFLDGLKYEEKEIDKEMEKLAKSMVDAIKKALGIKSPSTVMHEQGISAAQGLAKGLLDGEPIVLAAAKKLATAVASVKVAPPRLQAVQPGAPIIQVGTLPPVGTAQPLTIVHQHIAGSVLSEQQLQQYVQTATLKYTHRNVGNGLFLQGRASGTPAR